MHTARGAARSHGFDRTRARLRGGARLLSHVSATRVEQVGLSARVRVASSSAAVWLSAVAAVSTLEAQPAQQFALSRRSVSSAGRPEQASVAAVCVVPHSRLLSQALLQACAVASVCSLCISCCSSASGVQAEHHVAPPLACACTTTDARSSNEWQQRRSRAAPVLRVASDLTGGLPLEQWKTRVTRFPNETAATLRSVYKYQGGARGNVSWRGTGRKSSRRLVQRRSVSRAGLRAPVSATNSAVRRGHGARGVRGRCGGGRVPALVMGPALMLVTRSAVEGKSRHCMFETSVRRQVPVARTPPLYTRGPAPWRAPGHELGVAPGPDGFVPAAPGPPTCWPAACSAGSCWNTPLEVKRIRAQSGLRSLGDVGGGGAPRAASGRGAEGRPGGVADVRLWSSFLRWRIPKLTLAKITRRSQRNPKNRIRIATVDRLLPSRSPWTAGR